MAINKLNYKFNNKGSIQQGDRVLSKDTFQGIANKIDEIIDNLGLDIEESKIVDYSDSNNEGYGYIKLKNGLMFQWLTISRTPTMKAWGSIYYDVINDHGAWKVPFKKIYFSKPMPFSTSYWSSNVDSSITYTGAYYLLSGVPNNNKTKIQYISFGTWK